jgi:membrane protein DedA with SNARE-associated domain
MSLEQFLGQYGLISLFFLATVEGDLSLIVGGVLAHRGLFPLAGAVVAGAAGNFVGDCVWYLVGRKARTRLRETDFYRRAGPWIEKVAYKLGPWQLIFARLVYGTRNASMLFWGQYHLPFIRFTLIDLFGCALACTGFAGLGYLAGAELSALLGEVKRIEIGLLFAVIIAGVIVWLTTRGVKRVSGES